jgi:hypothetical protein
MADRSPIVQVTDTGATRAVWSGVLTGDVCLPVDYDAYADRTVQTAGVFGGATVAVQGSLEKVPVNWAVLTDPQGNDLNIATAKIEMVVENTAFVRPAVSGGDGSTNLTITMFMRRK